MEISIVIPVYQAEHILSELNRRLTASLETITDQFEIILVDDCGPDQSWNKIKLIAQADKRVIGIRLSRNFGQHHAITAGLDHAKGNWIVVMDCDLQDQPEEIINLYSKAKEGYDIVFASRSERQDSFLKKMSSRLFYLAFSYLSGIKQDGTIGNFGIYSRKVIDSIKSMREPMRAFSPMARWVGFKKTSIPVQHAERYEGHSSYNWNKLFKLGFDVAIAYSDKPLKITIKLGLIISLLAVLYTLYILVAYQLGIITMSGYASIIISIWFLSGLIIFTLGILGLYLSRIFEGIKNRPLYLIDEYSNEI